MQKQSGGKHTIYYSIQAVDIDGDKVILGEGFKGDSEAEAAMRLIAREFALVERRDSRPSHQDDGLLGPEVLT